MTDYYTKIYSRVFATFLLIFSLQAFGQEAANGKVLRLTLKDAVKRVIDTNATVQNAKFEILKADTPIYKNESKFKWILIAEAVKSETKLPFNLNNFFSGTKLQTDKLSAGDRKSVV